MGKNRKGKSRFATTKNINDVLDEQMIDTTHDEHSFDKRSRVEKNFNTKGRNPGKINRNQRRNRQNNVAKQKNYVQKDSGTNLAESYHKLKEKLEKLYEDVKSTPNYSAKIAEFLRLLLMCSCKICNFSFRFRISSSRWASNSSRSLDVLLKSCT